MSEPAPGPLPTRRFTLTATPPIRPIFIAALTEVLGAGLLVAWRAAALPLAVAVVGALLLALGSALLVAAVVLTSRLRTEVRLEPETLTVTRGGRPRSVPWNAIEEVKLSHPRLRVITADPEDALTVVNPRRPDDPAFADLLDQIKQRLDANRGYRPLE